MQKLRTMVDKNPDLKSDRADYLKLAVKEGKSVRGTGPHKVKLVGCENDTNKDYMTQQDVKGVNLLFEEDGAVKKYFVPTLNKDGKFHYLIERFADIKEGAELILEYKRREGSIQGFIDVQEAGEGGDDLPIVEDDPDNLKKDGATKTDSETELDIDLEG